MHTSGRQLKAGALFVAVGLFFLGTSLSTLEIGSTLRMGPGFLPIVLALLLIALGVGVIVEPGAEEDEESQPIPWRGLIFITLAPLLFTLLVKGWGLVPAILALIVTATLASRMMRLSQIAIVTAVLLGIVIVLFSYLLKLPYPLFVSTLSLSAG